ncbi:MAG: O-antigen ligase family protein [Candidatus Harrisonbacteria bacterium]|nr:O-antigen ligase family protein [Candidatus Harrisonbacteria bacterium]
MPSAILWIIKGGLFIVPFIPLYVSRVLFFPYITGKAFIFRIIVEVVFAAWVFLAIYYKEYRPKKSPLLIALAIFIAVVALATIFGVNPAKSFWSNYERMEGLVAYLHLFAYFLVLTHVFRKSDWKIFFTLFIVSSIYENTYAFLQRMEFLPAIQGGSYRVDGTIGNPTYLAAYLTFILWFCLFLWLEAKEKWQKYFYGLMAVWALATIYFTGTRGAILGLIIGIFVFGILYLIFKKTENHAELVKKEIILAWLLIALIIPLGIFLTKDQPFVKNNPTLARLTSLSFSERTIRSRFTIWGMGWEGFKERPILGWGPDNYGVVFSKYFKSELWRQEPWFDRSHNIVFDWLINAGILGALSYFSIFAVAIYLLWSHYRKGNFTLENTLLFTTFLAVYLAENFFVFDQIATYIGFFAVLAYINSISAATAVPGVSPPAGGGRGGDWPVAAGLLAAPLVLAIYFINIKPLQANLNLLDALAIQGQNIPLAFEKFNKALSYNTLGNQEIGEQLIRFAISAGGLPELVPDFRDRMLRKAIEEADKSVVENALDPRPYLFLGTIYNKVGLLDLALEVFKKASDLSPQKQQIYFEIADVYIQKGDYKNAVAVLEKSFKLDSEFNNGRINLAAAYILNNQQREAEKLLQEGFGTADVADQILVQVYSRVQNYKRLAGIWGAFVKLEPKNLEYRKSLSGAHLLANQKASATQALEQAIKDFPEFKTEGENLIKEIKKQK